MYLDYYETKQELNFFIKVLHPINLKSCITMQSDHSLKTANWMPHYFQTPWSGLMVLNVILYKMLLIRFVFLNHLYNYNVQPTPGNCQNVFNSVTINLVMSEVSTITSIHHKFSHKKETSTTTSIQKFILGRLILVTTTVILKINYHHTVTDIESYKWKHYSISPAQRPTPAILHHITTRKRKKNSFGQLIKLVPPVFLY